MSSSEKRTIFNSHGYARRAKKLTELVKTLRNVARIPSGALPRLKAQADDSAVMGRAKADSLRLNKETVHFFLEMVSSSFVRTGQAPSSPKSGIDKHFLSTPQKL